MADMTQGASIAVNGVCLTAVDPRPDSFSADLAPETLRRSNLGDLRAGSRVNLERPLSPSGRLERPHRAGPRGWRPASSSRWTRWATTTGGCASASRPSSTRFLVYKGSIAIDGISLTIAALEGDVLSVTIIPHTWTQHHARRLSPRRARQSGVRHPGQTRGQAARKLDVKSPLTVEKLRENGY